MSTLKEIKRRKSAIQSTEKITASMKLIATAKLQKAQKVAQEGVPYFDTMYNTISEILVKSQNVDYKYSKNNPEGKVALVVISSNRGLAGGFNANLLRKILKDKNFDTENTYVYALGKKVRDMLKTRKYNIYKDYSDEVESASFDLAKKVSNELLKDYEEGKISSIYLCYSFFKNTIVHIPTILKLLPITLEDIKEQNSTENIEKNFTIYKSEYIGENNRMIMSYEPKEDEILNMLIPKYISSTIYQAHTTSIASENGSRMTAMDSATKNANDLIDKLSIQYNRARQGAITQELTEIIAGANAI